MQRPHGAASKVQSLALNHMHGSPQTPPASPTPQTPPAAPTPTDSTSRPQLPRLSCQFPQDQVS